MYWFYLFQNHLGVNSLFVNMTWENPISFYWEIKVINNNNNNNYNNNNDNNHINNNSNNNSNNNNNNNDNNYDDEYMTQGILEWTRQNSLKIVFCKFYLVHFWILCPICSIGYLYF